MKTIIEERAQKAADDLLHWLNASTHSNKLFCEFMSRDHRTLQQLFTGLCFAWIRHCATDEYGRNTDGRNEASHDKCKRIVEACDDIMYVPYI